MIPELIYQLDRIKKTYDQRLVLDLPSLDIHRGEILSIVGPSGAGKSTLLRLMNFLEYPNEGSMSYLGQSISDKTPLSVRRTVTMLFQRPALLNQSIEENIRYGLRLRGASDANGLVDTLIERLGLQKLRKNNARHLSSGEAQRVALARALVIQPTVLLLDEPTANLDPYNIGLIETVIKEINEQYRTTIILVTHNVFQARRMSHRSVLLLNGNMIEIAETERFFRNPQDHRTGDFVKGIMIY